MKFPVLGLMIAIMLGQYGLMSGTNIIALAMLQPSPPAIAASMPAPASNPVFCRAGPNASWSCPSG